MQNSVFVMRSLIILGCLVALVAAQGGTDNCQSSRLLACSAGLGGFWNVDASLFWSDLNVMKSTILGLMKTPYGIYNYVNVCNGWAQFYACMGQQQIRSCLGIIGLVGSGKSPETSYAYMGYLAEWQFKCGPGFFSVYENANLTSCTQSTFVNYNADLQKYYDTFAQNSGADSANACDYAQTLMNSVSTTYQTGPCRSVDSDSARWYGCQESREYTNAQFRHCQHTTSCIFR